MRCLIVECVQTTQKGIVQESVKVIAGGAQRIQKRSNKKNRRWHEKHPEERRAKVKRWRKNNPKKRAEQDRRYWAKYPEKRRDKFRRWCGKHPEKNREKKQRYYAKNREKLICIGRQRHRSNQRDQALMDLLTLKTLLQEKLNERRTDRPE
jgi:hypothetical protein